MFVLETEHGFLSHRFIIRLERGSSGRWAVFYQSGSQVVQTIATDEATREFFEKLERAGR